MSVPAHLGIILDGNRRWAKANGLATLEGHRKGYENLKTIADAAIERGVQVVTAYVFSTENWNRSQEEVNYLMELLLWVATHEVNEMHKKGIRIRFLGSEQRLSPKILKAIKKAEEKTAGNTRGTLGLCLNYGGQTEIVEAVQAIGEGEVTMEAITQHLYAPDLPPVDMVIRTSGEQRLSNFMLWRAAYAELYFTDVHWPAFSETDLDAALAEFASRQRRFGG
jgi:undecaprenyl diphosphate synthase